MGTGIGLRKLESNKEAEGSGMTRAEKLSIFNAALTGLLASGDYTWYDDLMGQSRVFIPKAVEDAADIVSVFEIRYVGQSKVDKIKMKRLKKPKNAPKNES